LQLFYEAGKFVSDFMLLRIGEVVVRVSTPEPVATTKVKVSRQAESAS